MRNIRVLYVEDDGITRMMLSHKLRQKFSDVFEASNGQEGLSMFKEQSPDIVVTDLSMPVMNGHEMIRKIREVAPDAKIIITSAYADELTDLNCTVLDKPIVVDHLFDSIEQAV